MATYVHSSLSLSGSSPLLSFSPFRASQAHGQLLAVDGFIVSERFLYRVRKCLIRYEVKNKFWPAEGVVGLGALSDHWPVLLSLEMAEL